MTQTSDRKQAERRGRLAENLAVYLLRLKGYQVLAQRVKYPVGEVDIIARKHDILAFIEVKQRKSEMTARQAVVHSAWQRIARAAELWAARSTFSSALNWRYDLITVSGKFWMVHHKDYWRP